MFADNAEGGDISGGKRKRLSRPAERPTLEGKQSAEGSSKWFCEYLRMNMDSSRGTPDTEKIGNYRSYYYNTLAIPVPQFQGDGELIHRVRWTGKEGFRGWDKSRADWIWIRWKEHSPLELQMGQLDGRMVGWLEGLFSVHNETRKVHEVALVVLLRLRRPAKPSGEEGMIRVELRKEWKQTHMIRIADIEEMAHLIPLETGKTWVCNEIINIGDYEKMGWEVETLDTKETAEGPGRQGVRKACTGCTGRQEVGKGRQGARKFLVRHRMPSETGSQAGSQKILGKAQDALRDRKVRKGRTRCLSR
ncbi:hypothetical protein BGX38DRAFT_1147607 [Terfezia claveryi]|nr:hypothetical protein BGX38DRAFT_1147607 [Terfezia claveryi]